jgi:hypothetical protein
MGFIMKNVQLCVIALVSFMGLGAARILGELLPSEAKYMSEIRAAIDIRSSLGLPQIDPAPFNKNTKRGMQCNEASRQFVKASGFYGELEEKFDMTDEALSMLWQCSTDESKALTEYDKQYHQVGYDGPSFAHVILGWPSHEDKVRNKQAQVRFFKDHAEKLIQIRKAAKSKI